MVNPNNKALFGIVSASLEIVGETAFLVKQLLW